MNIKFKVIIPMIVVLIIIIICFFINRSRNSIIGLWDIDGNTKYQFESNGKGKLIVPSNQYIFSYKIKENIISIDFENEKAIDSEYEYKINKDVLEIKNIKETNLSFKLKKVRK